MNDAIKLQISAFVDGELPDNETELLLRRLSQDAELRTRAAQYLRIGRAIRGELELKDMSQLRRRISAALGEETIAAEPPVDVVPGRFMRPVAGVAVAASVAVLALIGLRQLGPADDVPLQSFDDRNAVAIDGGPSYTEPPVEEFMSDRPSDMLTLYYLRHGQQAANLGSRLVGLEVREDGLVSASGSPESSGQDGTVDGAGGDTNGINGDTRPEVPSPNAVGEEELEPAQ